MGDVSVSVTGEAADFEREMARAEQTLSNFSVRGTRSMDHLTGSGENLLRSNHRVAAQIHRFSQDLLAGADAGTIMGTAIEGLGRAMNLSLGALAGLAVGGVLAKQMVDVAIADAKMKKQLETSLNPSSVRDFEASYKTIVQRIKRTAEAGTQALSRSENRGLMGSAVDAFKDLFFPGGKNRVPNSAYMVSKTGQLTRGQTASEAARDETAAAVAEARAKNEERIQSEIQSLKERGLYTAEKENELRMAAVVAERDVFEKELGGKRPDLLFDAQSRVDQLEKQIELTEKNATASKTAESILEKSRATLKDLAEHGAEWAPGGEAVAGVGRLARRAMHEEDLARESALRGKPLDAAEHEFRASQIKQGISTMKDSEKDLTNEFRQGIDSSTVMSAIRDELKRISFASED